MVKKSNRFVRLIAGLKARMALHLLRAMDKSVGGGLCTDRNGRVKLERKLIQKIFSLDTGLHGEKGNASPRSVEKHFHLGSAGTAGPSAPVGMTRKG
jgi:hypothetical protein